MRYLSLLVCCFLAQASFAAAPQDAYKDMFPTFNRIGMNALSRGNTMLAEVMLQRAIEQAERYGESDPRLYRSISTLADLYAREGNYDMAKPLYDRLISIAQTHPAISSSIASSLNNYLDLAQRKRGSDAGNVASKIAGLSQPSM